MKIYTFVDGTTAAIAKKNGDFVVIEFNKKTGNWDIKSSAKIVPEIIKKFKHRQKLAEKRDLRHTIADICGTSYKAAMLDMGLNG